MTSQALGHLLLVPKMTYFLLNGSQEQLGSPVSMDASTTHISKALGSLQKRK